jgi:hypothetical protein
MSRRFGRSTLAPSRRGWRKRVRARGRATSGKDQNMINLKPRHVDHRDGAGHLDPIYEVVLRDRVRDRARNAENTNWRPFVTGTSSTDPSAEESGEEFVMTVTSGEDGGESELDGESNEERGGPFVETSGDVQFAYGTDASNPADATREPFPMS